MKTVKMLPVSFVAIAAVIMLVSTSQANVEITPAAVTPTQPAVTESTPDTGIQLADEITRRIRRLGVNVIRFPNSRPSETVGEVC